MDEYLQANKVLWNEWTTIHEKSPYYDVEGFKAGRITLYPPEREALGDVTGKSILHLQCHFGMDTLSLARMGAKVTGVDFSDEAITLARSLSAEVGVPATFIQTDIYELPKVLDAPESFDIVFTSYGILAWLPDMERWAEVAAHFLKPGGMFYIVEVHSFSQVFDNEKDTAELKVRYPYFNSGPMEFEAGGSYADLDAKVETKAVYEWPHPLSEILNALIRAGLRIERFDEFTFTTWPQFPAMMEETEPGIWRFKDKDCDLPLLFAIQATK